MFLGMNFRCLLCLTLLSALFPGNMSGEVSLPAIISNHMVLEKSAKVPIWGKAEPGEEITVTLGDRTAKATAGADGRWTTSLDLKDSGPGPFEMTVAGKNKLTISDVLVGEVWVAGGQSNMEWVLHDTTGAAEEIAKSANPMFRQFRVGKKASAKPLDDCKGSWVAAGPQTSGGFTAVGYYFGKAIQNELGVPVGIICDNWGGTCSEAWTSPESLDTDPELKDARLSWQAREEAYPAKKQAYVDGLDKWIKEDSREDKPMADVSAYAGLDASTEGWVPVKVPGPVAAPGLPKTGAVWLRKEINIPEEAKGDLPLYLPLEGFDSVYWNGKPVKKTTIATFPGVGHDSRPNIPPKQVKQGKNVLAIRFYEPDKSAAIRGVPVAGKTALGGTWMARAEYSFPDPDPQKTAALPPPSGNAPEPQNVPGYLFNGMIHPILPYAITGVIWYQGESNSGRAIRYRTAFPLVIADWRKHWGRGDFPFYFCQIANYREKNSEPEDNNLSELREAQSMALRVPNTGQAVLIDLGEANNIHPRNKKDVGARLAAIALANQYGKNIPFSGPVFDSMKIVDDKAIVTFRHTEGGLVAASLPETCVLSSPAGKTAPLVRNSPGSEVEGFAICGADRKWVWADARIDGDKVIVRSDKVPAPVAVRYAWARNPTCNLYNGAGFPTSPFRTDDFPAVTAGVKL